MVLNKYTRHWQKVAPADLDLTGRVRWVLDNQVGHMGRFPALEAATGIKQPTWKKLAYGQAAASGRVVAALAKLKPELASWLETGIAAGQGQRNPELFPKSESTNPANEV